MLKRNITYEDFNGDTVTETFYFNLTKPEILELEVSYKEGIEGALKKMLAEEDRAALLELFKKIITSSYGEKSVDGKRFIKSAQLTEEFTQTNAYATLYMELLADSDAAANFINGVVPSDLAAEAQKQETQDKIAAALNLKEKEDAGNETNQEPSS